MGASDHGGMYQRRYAVTIVIIYHLPRAHFQFSTKLSAKARDVSEIGTQVNSASTGSIHVQ